MAIVTQYFLGAHVATGVRRVFAQQLNHNILDASAAPTSWSAVVNMQLNGAPLFGVDLTTIFVVSGAGVTGSLTVNLTNLAASPEFNTIVDAVIAGAQLTFDLDTAETVLVHLRALKSTDYLLNGPSAEAALPPGVAGNNFVVPAADALSNYTFEFSNNFSASAYTLTSTAVGGANITLAASGEAPRNEASSAAQVRISKTYVGAPKESILPAAIHAPTQLLLLLDRSGSMNSTSATAGTSKWTAATSVSNLFTRLYAELIPDRTASSGTLLSKYSVKFGTFTWTGPGDVATFVPGPAGNFAGASTTPSAPGVSPGGGTPIGEALVESLAQFSSGNKWARRELVLLTDGQDNTGTPALAALGAADLTPLSSNSANGVILHALSYAKTGETDAADLAAKATARDGQYQSTASGFDSYAPDALLRAYLPLLQNVIPAQSSTYSSPGIIAEAGLDKMVLVTTHNPGASSLVAVTTPSGTAVEVTAGVSSGNTSGYWWVTITRPTAGLEYGLRLKSGVVLSALPGGTTVNVFYDLSLRAQFGVDAAEIGQPVRLWAKITFAGEPVSGAEVRAALAVPGESVGQLTTQFVRSSAFVRAIRRKLLDPQLLYASLITTNLSLRTSKRVAIKAGQPRSLSSLHFNVLGAARAVDVSVPAGVDLSGVRAQLLGAAEEERNLSYQYQRYPLVLKDQGNGLYEYVLSSDQVKNAGVYTADFRADGEAGGAPFARNTQKTNVVVEPPSQQWSSVSLLESSKGSGDWTISIFPVNVLRQPLGPGLAHFASFQYVQAQDRRDPQLPQPITQDNLDGSYTTRLTLAQGKLPEIALFFGDPDAGAKAVVARPQVEVTHIKVTLNKIQVLDDHEPWFKGAGELTFQARVAPNGSPARAVQTRLPQDGASYRVKSGQTIELDQVIYEGPVEKGAALVVSLTGEELDWPTCLDKNDQLSRYLRRIPVPLQTTRYAPDDELSDPESLADWKVWYTVEVK